MHWEPDSRPQLRPLEPFRLPDEEGARIGLRDPGGLSDAAVMLSPAALQILVLMDGTNTCREIQEKISASLGVPFADDALRTMLAQLEQARFLEGPVFESYYSSRLEEYRSAKTRRMANAPAIATPASLSAFLDEMLAGAEPAPISGRLLGLIAPHLDYPRGRPCYAAAYAQLRDGPRPDRVVILGTNHFGRSTSVVATANQFETSLGTSQTDAEFIERLESRCGDLRVFELDHAREHSVELQVTWLQHMLGTDTFKIVPLLCPDPCGPTGTAPRDGKGIDLSVFAQALGDLVQEDSDNTLVVAGADLSHVGAAFGDHRPLDDAFFETVRARDRRTLEHLTVNDPASWLLSVAENGNSTRICSAGCVFTLVSALRGASGTILRYHQAVDKPSQTCVTCAAVAFTRDD